MGLVAVGRLNRACLSFLLAPQTRVFQLKIYQFEKVEGRNSHRKPKLKLNRACLELLVRSRTKVFPRYQVCKMMRQDPPL